MSFPIALVPLLVAQAGGADDNHIAFLKDASAWAITLVCMIPALAFTIYVKVDDYRQAKRSHDHH